MLVIRRAVAITAVIMATLAGGYGALVTFRQDAKLSAGTIRLSVSPGHRGALDLYVPVVDWGARFEAIRLPARLRVDLRTVDRRVVARLARGAAPDVDAVRSEAREAIVDYLRKLLGVVLAASAALGILVALAIRNRAGPRLRWAVGIALLSAVAATGALFALLPPRGPLDRPQYYAYGSDVPRALRAVESVRRSTRALDEELDAQLVGLAQLVVAPGERPALDGLPRMTVTSDLHNNVLTLPILERAARGGPVLFAGDATDRGTPLETSLTRRIVRTGRPFVFVSGNHDSDLLSRRFARDGAIVLSETGRLMPDGSRGPVVADVRGVRIAGYSDPFERRSAEDFRDRYDERPPPEAQAAFTAWLGGMIGQVDVVMVHEPGLIAPALERLRAQPPPEPIVFAVGHTHRPDFSRSTNVTVLNGGSIGGGGTGNLGEGTPLGLGVLVHAGGQAFRPLAADLVAIDTATGSSTARRIRLDD